MTISSKPHVRGTPWPPKKNTLFVTIFHDGKANFQFCFGGPRGCNKDVKNITFEISNLGYVYPENPTLISRLSMQKDGVEMHAKQRDGGQCYTYL